MTDKIIPTPCIGICSTVYGDEVCRGCQRTFDEITQWNGFTSAQKVDVLARIAELKDQVLVQYFVIEQPDVLKTAYDTMAQRAMPEQNSFGQLYALLRVKSDRLKDLGKWGVDLVPGIKAPKRLAQLFEIIDDELYDLACQGLLESQS